MNTPMNKRRLSTIENIDTAFLRLMQNKDLKEISVSELCEMAEINRSTFYANYDDLNVLAVVWCRKIEKQTAEQSQDDQDYTWLFEYVEENKHVFKVYFKLAMPPEVEDYHSAFRRRGIYAVVKSWLENGCIESAESMGAIIRKVLYQD